MAMVTKVHQTAISIFSTPEDDDSSEETDTSDDNEDEAEDEKTESNDESRTVSHPPDED